MVDNRWTLIHQLMLMDLNFDLWRDEAMKVWRDITLSKHCAWCPTDEWQELARGGAICGLDTTLKTTQIPNDTLDMPDGQCIWPLGEAGWLVNFDTVAAPDVHIMSLWRVLSSQWQLRGRLALTEQRALLESWLLSSVSHDLRAPLNSILGFLELVDKARPTVLGQLATVKSEAERLQGLINQLLDFSRLQAKRMVLVPTATNLLEWVGQTVAPWRVPASHKQLALRVDLVRPLPVALCLDAERLLQVVHNLFSNAIKFTSSGQVLLTVSAEQSIRHLYLEVSDTGVGIDPARQEHLFAPYVQARQDDQFIQGGMGLGLSIVKQLTELMGGEVMLVSTPQKGTSIKLQIPYEESVDPLAAEYHNCFVGEQAMLIDDDHDRASTVGHYLDYFGVETQAVTSGPEALFQLRLDGVVPDWFFIHSALKGIDAQTTLEGIARQLGWSDQTMADRVVWMTDAADDEKREYRSLHTPPTMINLYQTMMFHHHATVPNDRSVMPVVLVVDDTELNLQLSEVQLRKLGLSVITARSGEEALRRLAEQPVDLVFMDIMMPTMDGYETTRQIRSEQQVRGEPEVPIIALTASTQFRDPVTYRSAGMNDYLAKPYRPEQLYAILRRYLPQASLLPGESAVLPSHLEPELEESSLVAWDKALVMVGGDEAVLLSILGPFLAELPLALEGLSMAREHRDWPTLQWRAHSLKAMMRTFGALPLGAAIFALEQAAKAERAGEVEDAWQQFLALYSDTVEQLSAHLEERDNVTE